MFKISHTTVVELKIYNKEMLLEVLKDMGYKVHHEPLQTRSSSNVEFSINFERLKNIIFAKSGDHYKIIAYELRRTPKFQNFIRDLHQQYALKTIKRELQRGKLREYRIVSETKNDNNTIKLVLRGR